MRYRGMVQDVFEPEYYVSQFEYIDPVTSRKVNSGDARARVSDSGRVNVSLRLDTR